MAAQITRFVAGVRLASLGSLRWNGEGSDKAIDAFIVAVADLAGGAIVATGDPKDLKRLAGHATRVTVLDIR